MKRPRSTKVTSAPMAVTSAGEIVVSAYQLATKDDLASAVEVALRSGLSVFIGVVLPAGMLPELLHDVDDVAADIVGRLGVALLKRRGRR